MDGAPCGGREAGPSTHHPQTEVRLGPRSLRMTACFVLRIEDQGYTQVSALAKDDKSIWRGHAMKSGKAVDVALDYQGNVTAN